MKYSTLLLDLDGTLIDSYCGIEWAMHAALARVLPRCPQVELRDLIGPPLPEIFELYLARHFHGEISAAEKAAVLEELVLVFREYYDAEGFARCEPYPHVESTLHTLREKGVRQIIVTNKPAPPTALILEHLKWRDYFEAVFCPDTRQPNFAEKADAARHVVQLFSLAPHQTLFVGDSADDALAASGSELDFAAVLYGYGAAREYSPRHRLENFSQLLSIVDEINPEETALNLNLHTSPLLCSL